METVVLSTVYYPELRRIHVSQWVWSEFVRFLSAAEKRVVYCGYVLMFLNNLFNSCFWKTSVE